MLGWKIANTGLRARTQVFGSLDHGSLSNNFLSDRPTPPVPKPIQPVPPVPPSSRLPPWLLPVAGRSLSVYSLVKVTILGDAGALVFLNLKRSLIIIIVYVIS